MRAKHPAFQIRQIFNKAFVNPASKTPQMIVQVSGSFQATLGSLLSCETSGDAGEQTTDLFLLWLFCKKPYSHDGLTLAVVLRKI